MERGSLPGGSVYNPSILQQTLRDLHPVSTPSLPYGYCRGEHLSSQEDQTPSEKFQVWIPLMSMQGDDVMLNGENKW